MPKYKCGDQIITLDRVLALNLKAVREDLRKDRDSLIIVDGHEGSGKSVLTLNMAKFVDHNLNLDNVVFTPDDFRDRVLAAKKGTVICYDEAITGARSTSWAKDINKALVEMMAQVRQKNLCIFMVIPTIFEMQKYYAIHRSRALVHVYVDRLGRRGYFQVYNRTNKTQLYVVGKKYYSYGKNLAHWNFHGRFVNHYPIDEKEYRAKKLKAFMDGPNDTEDKEPVRLTRLRSRLAHVLHKLREDKWTIIDIEKLFTDKPRDAWNYSSIKTFLLDNPKEIMVREGKAIDINLVGDNRPAAGVKEEILPTIQVKS